MKTFIIYIISLVLLSIISCDTSPNQGESSDSVLIQKINAVHKQMMIQGNISEEEQLALASLARLVDSPDKFHSSEETDNAIPFDTVHTSPVFPGCEDVLTTETKECFTEKITAFFKENANTEIIKNLKLSPDHTTNVFFLIKENGSISCRKIVDNNLVLQAEIAKVYSQLPTIQPGKQNNKAADVLYSTFLSY